MRIAPVLLRHIAAAEPASRRMRLGGLTRVTVRQAFLRVKQYNENRS
jgi:hypothetical protein